MVTASLVELRGGGAHLDGVQAKLLGKIFEDLHEHLERLGDIMHQPGGHGPNDVKVALEVLAPCSGLESKANE